MNVSKAVLITGCSSGIGWATAGGRSGTPSDHIEGRRVGVQRPVVVHGHDRYVGASPGDHSEGWVVGVHHHDRGDTGGDRSPRETVVGDHKVDRSRLPQYISHWLGIV